MTAEPSQSSRVATDPTAAAGAAAPPTWATVTTLREPLTRVQAFVAHHLWLGASEIWLYFDDPDDPAIAAVAGIAQVRAVPCTPAMKAAHSNRSGSHESRQKANANHAYHRTQANWMIHLDADEMIEADRPLAALLASARDDVVRLPPFEALHHPAAGQGMRPSHLFRGPLPDTDEGRAAARIAYGRFAGTLAAGMLSHAVGKFFLRTGIEGGALSIHAPLIGGRRARGSALPGLRLLHLHGGDYDEWRAHLSRRLASGAYVAKFQKDKPGPDNLYHTLATLLRRRGEAGARRFWTAVSSFGPEKRVLGRHGALHRSNLWIEPKVAAVFGGATKLRHPGRNPESGAFEADVDWQGLVLRLSPDTDAPDLRIARGEDGEAPVWSALGRAVAGRRIAALGLGANGFATLLAARQAGNGAVAVAALVGRDRLARFARNAARNGIAAQAVRLDPRSPLEALAPASPGVTRLVLAEPGPPLAPLLAALSTAAPDLLLIAPDEDTRTTLAALGYRPLAQGQTLTLLSRSTHEAET